MSSRFLRKLAVIIYWLGILGTRKVFKIKTCITSSVFIRDRTGGITFGDFMEFLSVITKGTTEDKLQWAFTFYDVNHDGVISREELIKVIQWGYIGAGGLKKWPQVW